MICKKSALCVVLSFTILSVFSSAAFSQVFQRPRIVQTTSTPVQPISSISQLPYNSPVQRPVLTSKLVVSTPVNSQPPTLVKKTVSSSPVNLVAAMAFNSSQLLAYSPKLKQQMDARLGIPYHYGSTSGNSYDCSGLVWSVFQSAGINFERSSARSYWQEFEPVYGDDRYQFGTLVFFNRLGHIGIVVDENGFYQASSSKGVTYTPFAGYWEKRIVGFRRVPASYFKNS